MKRNYLLIWMLCFVFQNVFSQSNNVWIYPGNFRIDFNSGIPVITPDTFTLGSTNVTGRESNASYCDINGNLFCWSQGEKIYTKNNTIMEGGDSLNGNYLAGQGVIILESPIDESILYAFTVCDGSVNQSNPFTESSLRYHIIDKSLNNGLGKVILKNQFLLSEVYEKITATRHCNGKDWWVVCQPWNTNAFHSFLIDSNGVHPQAVVSNIGTLQGLITNSIEPDGKKWGEINISPNSKYLVHQNYYEGRNEGFLFDNSTGIVTNELFNDSGISIVNGNQPITGTGCSGATFSPNSRFYYTLNEGPYFWHLIQYDLWANSDSAIISSKINVIPDTIISRLGIQLGPGKIIYLDNYPDSTWTNFQLSYISKPDKPGLACEPIFNAYNTNINGHLKNYRMPNSANCEYVKEHQAVMHIPLCGGLDSAIAVFDTLLNVVHDFTWNFGDPASGANNTATGTDPVHAFTAPGNYTITLTATNACNTFTITRNVFIGISTAVPPVITQNGFQLESTPGVSYQWFFNGQPIPGATLQSIIPTQAGMYTVQVSDAGGCVLQSEGFYLYVTQSMQKEKLQLKIYPNPASQQVYIQSGSPVVSVQAINMSGQCINLSYRSFGTYDVTDISTLSCGLYILRICTQEGVEIKKLQVE